jgi:hypothetical protein
LRRDRRRALVLAALVAAGTLRAEPGRAEPGPEHPSGPTAAGWRAPVCDRILGLVCTLEGAAAIGGFTSHGTNFGAGRIDSATGEATGDASWFEGYLKPSARASFGGRGFGTLYAAATGIATLTRGEGDAAGFTDGSEEDLALEQLFAGWNSGGLWPGRNSIDVSIGRQELHLGDSFLVDDGNFELGRDGAYWLTPRRAFPRTAVLSLGTPPGLGTRPGFDLERGGDTEPVRGDLFYLKADRDRGRTEVVGANLEYASAALLGRFQNLYWGAAESGRVGATYLRAIDSGGATRQRKDMNALHLWATGVRVAEGLPWLPELLAWGGFVREWGGDEIDVDASAWYAEAGLDFGRLLPAWLPLLRYRYSRFSGDSDPGDASQRAFDPLFYGFNYNRGSFYGTWFQGEIVGEYLIFNTNQRVHTLHLTLWPAVAGLESGELLLGVALYAVRLDAPNFRGVPLASRRFAREIDVYATWRPRLLRGLALEIGPVLSVAWPGPAAREFFGDDETTVMVQGSVSVAF